MTTFILLILVLGCTILFLTMKKKKTTETNQPKEPIVPTQNLDDLPKIEIPIEVEPEPTNFTGWFPSDEEGEMPIKPTPKKCQKASFRPAPEKFFYTDCCGEFHEGEGFQPFEKRSQVLIDTTKEFSGMDIEEGEIEFEC